MIRSAFLVLALIGHGAAAQDIAAPLRDMLARVPMASLGDADLSAFVMFGDNRAAVLAMSTPPEGTGAHGLGPYGPAFRATVSGFRDFDIGLLGQMPLRTGFGLDEIETALTIENPPQDITILSLSPDAAARVPAALLANGYVETTQMGYPAFARGEGDYSVDFTQRDTADPFGGNLGRASRIALDGNVLMQAAGWPELTLLHDAATPMLADRPDMAAILDALNEGAPNGAVVVRALVMQDQVDFTSIPAPEGVPIGVPSWPIGIMADLSTGHTETGMIALPYATEALAHDAAARLLTGWNQSPFREDQTLASVTGGTAKSRVLGDGPFVALLLVSAPTEVRNQMPANLPFETMLEAMFMRQLGIVGMRSGG